MDLNDLEAIKKLDTSQVAFSIESFHEQIKQAWEETQSASWPLDYKEANKVVVVGMGGSALGPEVIKYLYKDSLRVPFEVVNSYHLPSYVDSQTLIVLVSYSGTTEEVLSAADEALQSKGKILAVTQGHQLGEKITTKGLPVYVFDPKYNPSRQPRLGLGYTLGGVLGILSKLELISVQKEEIQETLAFLSNLADSSKPTAEDSPAKKLSKQLENHQALIVAGEFLSGNAHIFANQLNESSKSFAAYFLLSELNHHLLEGLGHPQNLGAFTKFVFLESALYSKPIRKRLEITKEVVKKQGLEEISVSLKGKTKLEQVFESIAVSSWGTFYLGMLYGVDPAKIPWVDYFKEKLAKG